MVSITAGFKKARLWTETVPEYRYIGPVHRCSIIPSHGSRLPARGVAVELLIPVGPRSLYAALGAEFVPSSGHELEVRVLRSKDPGQVISWALASAVDEVRSGLPLEFADVVAEATQVAPDLVRLGAGTLTINQAAYGVVSSNKSTFKRLAVAVVCLLGLEDLPDESTLRNILDL